MSNAGTARKGFFGLKGVLDFKGVVNNFLGNNDEIEEDIESFEKIDTKNVDVTAKELEELKKSSGRLNVLAERYGIEPKNLKAKSKTPKAKTAVIKKQNLKVKENQKQNEIEQEEIDRER